jgi:hypothetical protein
MAWKTVRFHTGDRVVRLRYDPDDPMRKPPVVGEVKQRHWLADILVIAAGGFLAMNAIRYLGKRDARIDASAQDALDESPP